VANIKSKADIKSLDLKFCLIKTGNKKYTNAPSFSHKIQQHTGVLPHLSLCFLSEHTFHLLPPLIVASPSSSQCRRCCRRPSPFRRSSLWFQPDRSPCFKADFIYAFLFVNLNSIKFRKLLLKSKTGVILPWPRKYRRCWVVSRRNNGLFHECKTVERR
jgi:hypothetical protein